MAVTTSTTTPTHGCDLIMKGGITSGVVYPKAIEELSRSYRLCSIGGTSAGAIAAGMAAAAEYGRANDGFTKLGKLGEQLPHILLTLFQATPASKPFYNAGMHLISKGWFWKRFALATLHLAWGMKGWMVCAAVIGAGIGGAIGWGFDLWFSEMACAILGVLGVLVAIPITIALQLRKHLIKELPEQCFALCSGMPQPGYGNAAALTPWLAETINDIAGKEDGPLTFGDIWGLKPGEQPGNRAELLALHPKGPRIDLQVMTTNVTEGRPYNLPFETRIFMWRPDEWKKLFPKEIIDHLIAHSHAVENFADYRWLPKPGDMPLVVPVRMSLSFPILLAAVPMYARDFTITDQTKQQQPKRCWFSDGGISSNFPIHLFDRPFPSRPTFGISLDAFDPDRHGNRVSMPVKANQGILRAFSDIHTLPEFLSGIMNSMQNWQDAMRSSLPGYRERVVRVRLNADEGGLNLDMPESLIKDLVSYGQEAGKTLVRDFDFTDHRWRRYLVWMASFERSLFSVKDRFDTYDDFLESYAVDPASYKQTQEWLEATSKRTTQLVEMGEQWLEEDIDFNDGKIPKPFAELSVNPRA